MRIRVFLVAVVSVIGSIVSAGSATADTASSATAPPGAASAAGLAAPARGSAVQVGPTLPTPAPTIPPEEALPGDSGTGRRLVYSNSRQRVWAVDENGTVVKTHQVSGRIGTPGAGTYRVWGRSETTCAVSNSAVCWRWMVRFAIGPNGGNVGFHEIPLKHGQPVQTEAQLGQALSGGCVRQATADALWIWEWAQLDTVVVVV